MQIDTSNKFLVALAGDRLVILRAHGVGRISPDDALLLAAYLVSIAEPFAANKFNEVLEAVQNA